VDESTVGDTVNRYVSGASVMLLTRLPHIEKLVGRTEHLCPAGGTEQAVVAGLLP
jgi:hypothetical protein